MARPKNVTPTVYFQLGVPKPLYQRLQLLFWSESEARIPYGVLPAFINQAIEEKLDRLNQEIQNGNVPGTVDATGTDSSQSSS